MATLGEVEMGKELYLAAVNGDVEFLGEDKSNEYLLRKTHEKNNIIHVAIRHEQHDFIEACLKRFIITEIICENNPFHVAAEVGNLLIMSLLYDYIKEKIINEGYRGEEPWKVKDLRGNTPLHVAIIHGNVNIGKFLLEEDTSLAYIVNKLKEAPLHLAIKQHVDDYSVSESIMAKAQQSLNEGGAALTIIRSAPQEEMSVMIKLLIQKAGNVTCLPDAKGLTPLHKVASFTPPYNIDFMKLILDNCPQSAEVCDNTGKSILHLLINNIPNYHETFNLLSRKEIYALRNHQDHQGNTPLHIAAKNKDINMVRFLLESSAKLNINNMEGMSAATAIQQQDVLQMLRERKLKRDGIEATDKENIVILRERMSKLGMDFVLSQDSEGKNILHRIMLIKKERRVIVNDFVKFVEEALEKYPSLINQTDSKGDTPIHILVRNHADTPIFYVASNDESDDSDGNPDYVLSSLWESKLLPSLLEICNQCIVKIGNEASLKGARFYSPWLMQNDDGNTPLHEALKSINDINLVKVLLNYDQKSVSVYNKKKETPLHLLASLPIVIERGEVKAMVDANEDAAFFLDDKQQTPVVRAIKAGNISAASMLCKASPKAAEIGDENGQTYGHLIVKHPSEYYFARLFKDKELRELLQCKDSKGNTPLHLAIMDKRFDLLKFFLMFWKQQRKLSKGNVEWIRNLLEMKNGVGETPNDLIANFPSLPSQIKEIVLNDTEMIGFFSTWGIPAEAMKTYVNTMGVIAALLATISFTAAFTVPGGVIQDDKDKDVIGSPLLVDLVAFQAFMFFDISTMCLSTMVLFCLLWTFDAGSKRKSLMLMDFGILLLLISFYTTLLTFMTGVYVTTIHVKPWIAIYTLVICTTLLLLMRKFIVIEYLGPIGSIMSTSGSKFIRYIKNKKGKDDEESLFEDDNNFEFIREA